MLRPSAPPRRNRATSALPPVRCAGDPTVMLASAERLHPTPSVAPTAAASAAPVNTCLRDSFVVIFTCTPLSAPHPAGRGEGGDYQHDLTGDQDRHKGLG